MYVDREWKDVTSSESFKLSKLEGQVTSCALRCALEFSFSFNLKGLSVVGVIIDKMKYYTVVNGVQYFFSTLSSLFSAKLHVSIREIGEVTS